MDITVIITQLTELFLLIALGYGLCKFSIFDAYTNKKITKLLLNVCCPCLVLNSVINQTGEKDFQMVGLVILVSALYYAVMPLVSFLLVKLMRIPRNQTGLYMFMSIYENVGFMGFPLINAIYGSTAVLYTAIFNIGFNVTAFTVGVLLIGIGTEQKNTIDLKNILSPGTSLSALAIVVYFANLQFPEVVKGTISSIASATTPLAMMIVGSTLAMMSVKEIFNDYKVYIYLLLRQVILPFITFPLFKLFIHDELLLGVTFILYIMPTANTAVLFATNYGCDEKLASRCVFITTAASIITIPLLVSCCLL